MKGPESGSGWRDAARAAALSAALVLVVGGAGWIAAHWRHVRAWYCAVRLVTCADEHEEVFRRLPYYDRAGQRALCWAYRRISEEKRRLVEQGLSMGLDFDALHALVQQEGIDTPAEEALIEAMTHEADMLYEISKYEHFFHPSGAEILVKDFSPPPENLKAEGSHNKTALHYRFSHYEVKLQIQWFRSVSASSCLGGAAWKPWMKTNRTCAVRRIGPSGHEKDFGVLVDGHWHGCWTG